MKSLAIKNIKLLLAGLVFSFGLFFFATSAEAAHWEFATSIDGTCLRILAETTYGPDGGYVTNYYGGWSVYGGGDGCPPAGGTPWGGRVSGENVSTVVGKETLVDLNGEEIEVDVYSQPAIEDKIVVNVYQTGISDPKVEPKTGVGRLVKSFGNMFKNFYGGIFGGSQARLSNEVEEVDELEVVFDPATGLAVCLSQQTIACANACGVSVSDLVPINGQGTYAGYGGYYCSEVYAVAPAEEEWEGDLPEVIDDEVAGVTVCLSSNQAACQQACGSATLVPIGDQGAYAGNTGFYCTYPLVANPETVIDESLTTTKDLYCEIDYSLSPSAQVSQIEKCARESDLSSAEKEAVINATKN
jgi:hypothetical protein